MGHDEYAGRDNLELMADAKNYNDYLLGLILKSASKDDTVVDFGAGSGIFSFPLAAVGFKVICVETDVLLSAGISSRGLEVLCDLNEARDESVDYIYSLNVLEHIENDVGILNLWNRKLRPGGKVLIYVPAFEILFSSMDRKVGHLRRYRKKELCRKLGDAGFEVVEAHYADSLGFLATLLYRVAGRDDGGIHRKILRIYDRLFFPASRTLDVVTRNIFGKNVYARAVKPTNK